MPEEQRLARRATTWRSAALWAAVSGVVTRRARELGRPLRVLDLGGGTGGVAVPLAGANHHVTVVDPSPNALAALQRRAVDSGAAERITALQGDADTLAQLLPERGFDLVCCHGVLEVVDDPEVTLAAVAEALAGDGYLSLLVAGRLAAVLAKTLAGEFSTAAALLSSEGGSWGPATRSGGASTCPVWTPCCAPRGWSPRCATGSGSSATWCRPPTWTPTPIAPPCSTSSRLPSPTPTMPSSPNSAPGCTCSPAAAEPAPAAAAGAPR